MRARGSEAPVPERPSVRGRRYNPQPRLDPRRAHVCFAGLAGEELPIDHLRNVALIGHSGTGKTSLTEALHHVTAKTARLGRVEDGNTVSDHDPDEIERGMSINLSVVPCAQGRHKINVIDTPGYADFVGEVVSGLQGADAAVVVIDATAGVQVGTESAWRLAERLRRPRLLVVNRMDRENVVWQEVVDSLRARFGNGVAPVQVPLGNAPDFTGVVDLLDSQAHVFGGGDSGIADMPEEVADAVEEAREQLVDAVAATDDVLLEKYLEDEELSRVDLEAGLKAGVSRGELFPVLFTAATRALGVRELLPALIALLPSPQEVMMKTEAGGAELAPAEDGAVAAQVFKTLADPFVGKVSMFRVFSGTISGDVQLLNTATGRTERLGGAQFPSGKEGTPSKAVVGGDIAFVTKLDGVSTGDTLVSPESSVRLPAFEFPMPLFDASVTPETSADLDKMSTALSRLADEDPSLQVRRSEETGETILAGLGESHVQISLDRARRKFGVRLRFDVPLVAYRETIRRKVNAHGRHKRQTGGHGQFGDVHIEFAPLERGAGFVFENRVVGGRVPRQYIPAVEKGLTETLDRGGLARYPVVDLSAALFDGQFHSVDSSDESFRIAARLAYEDGYRKASPVILEPILKLAITIPDGNTGDVIGDISARRGHVLGMAPADDDGFTTVEVEVPEAEVQRYATDLRSMTQGRGAYTRAFVRLQEVPPNVQERLVAEAARRREEG